MEIVLRRIAKKKEYTIGRLYLLGDDEVKRTALPGKKCGDKRTFLNMFSRVLLDKEHYLCDTLEPAWRNLHGIELKPEEEDERNGRKSGVVAKSYLAVQQFPRVLTPCSSLGLTASRSGCRSCRAFLCLKVCAST